MDFSHSNKESRKEEFFPVERQQRLDLILHLIPNARGVILLRGPERSGKSFFITQLEKQVDTSWQFCVVPAEDLMQTSEPLQIFADVFDNSEGNNKQIIVRFEAWSKAGKKVIVCIEDAQKLDATKFKFLFKLSDTYDCVQIILTSSENLGETIESRCQLIDIEPFTQKQTTEYARQRVHKKNLGIVDLVELDDVVLFIETGGLPGRINDALEQMGQAVNRNERRATMQSMPLVWAVGAALVVMGYLFFGLYSEKEIEPLAKKIETEERQNNRVVGGVVKPFTGTEAAKEPVRKSTGMPGKVIEVENPAIALTALPKPRQKEAPSVAKTIKKAAVVTIEKKAERQRNKTVKTEPEKPIITELMASLKVEKTLPKLGPVTELTVIQSNHLWINSRIKNHFTLQLMSVSTKASASNYLSQNEKVKQLHFFQHKRNGGKWFSVVYGDFENKEMAISAARKLPVSLGKLKPWVRDFRAIQRDLFVKK